MAFRALTTRFTLALHVTVNHFLWEKQTADLNNVLCAGNCILLSTIGQNSAADMKQQLLLKF
jgi:hypothetical protein